MQEAEGRVCNFENQESVTERPLDLELSEIIGKMNSLGEESEEM